MTALRSRTLAVLATAPLLAAVLAGCGSDDDGGGSGSDGGASGSASDFVTGTPEEWLQAVCGDDSTVSPYSSVDSLLARYGKDATEGYSCDTSLDGGGGSYTYPEAALFDADPSKDWQPGTGKTYLTFGIGQVSEDQWAVVYEDSSTEEITDPHLEPLTDFGFEVYENNEAVG